jgi:hypothetical protein
MWDAVKFRGLPRHPLFQTKIVSTNSVARAARSTGSA